MSDTPGKLRLGALVALVVGSMIGGGIFSLPQNMAASADVGAVLIGWAITAVGMLTLAFVFQTLANRKPDLDGGVYAYAKAGFGDYMGFSSAWGYWISAWLGNVGYFVLLFSTLGYFFPIFGEGNTPAAVIGASALLWAVHFLVLRGIKEAAFINLVTTVAKVVPLLLFVLIAIFAFKLDIFTADIWGLKNPDLGSVMNQVRNMMLVTVWVFIGIEGASIFSARAEKRTDVGKATVIGFITVLLFLVLVNVLSLGIMTQPELAKLQNPSMAAVLEHVVGHWGAVLISVGLIISLLGALLSWVLLCAVLWAVHVAVVGRFSRDAEPIRLSLIQLGMTGVGALSIAITRGEVSGEAGMAAISAAKWALIYGAILPVAVAFTLQVIAQKKAPPTHTALILSLESVFGMACGIMMLGERPDMQKYTGAALMLAGVVVSQVIRPKSDGGSVEMADKMLSDDPQPR